VRKKTIGLAEKPGLASLIYTYLSTRDFIMSSTIAVGCPSVNLKTLSMTVREHICATYLLKENNINLSVYQKNEAAYLCHILSGLYTSLRNLMVLINPYVFKSS
jgi:hypothetical protein